MTKSLKNLWARLLFRDRGIVPTKRFLILFGIYGVVMIVLAATAGMGWLQLIVTTVLLIALSLIDQVASPRRKDLTFKREMPNELERDVTSEVTLAITNTSSRTGSLIIKDDVHQSIHAALPLKTYVPPQSRITASYEITAPIRGDYHLEALFVRIASRFKLWEKQTAVQLSDSYKVIPDLTDTRHFLENAQQFLLHEGIQVRKMHRGEGEFAQIRNYVVGDDPRKINWRQTAKLRELMTNEYEPEHGKHITILIDCGRMMGSELSQGNRLEKALEAAMTVAAAALKNGDYVGLLAFGTRVQTHVPAAKGMDHMQTILHAIYNLKVEAGESNYAEMMTYLQTTQKKEA
ncbi:hypothetical protein JNUCC1_01319 [Lentibacillus sp. JNUCC-1]|uniref:DUF58 domain-containing protein n=1 Tax=Lentibacillus sp. JNUCC-1 TaxID=2654513 RepID=UPI001320B7EF|nr:DUF58 domain-containing protein [Lentibacillus sp. JNUCC-1]MUV37513.1 hypothetical protein [Lentibacillus sp. JNUCC-1]